MNALDIAPGMNVYSRDNLHLGQVTEVWTLTKSHGYLPRSRTLISDYGPIKGTAHMFATDSGYMDVVRDSFLGFGGHTLHIPLAWVRGANGPESISLHSTATQCEGQLSTLVGEERSAA